MRADALATLRKHSQLLANTIRHQTDIKHCTVESYVTVANPAE